ncbi:hypothetical protein FIU94_14960 [Sulfitobacter sp. THAF37]|uniref:DUF4169 family protein n=1 Tax=Sulfitobacter sp. THAF37 TaxID=2587855 RepID=UPI001269723C|nr:DUF4169 family protein [Sulfitobacter sp. THAF37]QFT60128.1 hypothetical protein FIU94_14960 [Sulfitobacter sp. THAF37]
MSTPVNLNKIRKERDRAARKARADENAVKFGQTKAQKDAQKARAAQQDRDLDGHKRET